MEAVVAGGVGRAVVDVGVERSVMVAAWFVAGGVVSGAGGAEEVLAVGEAGFVAVGAYTG